jgi:hypothetical protein
VPVRRVRTVRGMRTVPCEVHPVGPRVARAICAPHVAPRTSPYPAHRTMRTRRTVRTRGIKGRYQTSNPTALINAIALLVLTTPGRIR